MIALKISIYVEKERERDRGKETFRSLFCSPEDYDSHWWAR